jgi:carboxypeptidase Taq
MGFHENNSRLDLSAHPFCSTLLPDDVRMTTRVNPDDPFFSIFAVLHEGGHGLYGLGRPKEQFGSPLADSLSLGIDESQSRWWETLIGQSYPFWQHFFPLLQAEFPEQFNGIHLEDFYRAINHVKPSFIRIESDEVTYNLHIIVRFEMEKALIEGSLKVKDIPDAWNEKMREYLGISPQFDGEGCLQDIHWSLGLFGYFPTYTLGNLYASQFFQPFEKTFPSWKERVSQGDLDFIREWLKENIHQYGRQYPAEELCRRVTAEALSEEPFIRYLHHKYQSLYRFSS